MKALRTLALQYPECEEGIACKGTAIECTTFKARSKAFLFMARADVRIKLRESLPEAAKLAVKEPGRYTVGASGWIKVTFSDDEPLPLDVLTRWIDESYRLLAPKQLVARLPMRGSKKSAKKKKASR